MNLWNKRKKKTSMRKKGKGESGKAGDAYNLPCKGLVEQVVKGRGSTCCGHWAVFDLQSHQTTQLSGVSKNRPYKRNYRGRGFLETLEVEKGVGFCWEMCRARKISTEIRGLSR